MNKYKTYIPALILAFGAILRVITIGSAAIWYDEAISLYRTTIPFMQLFTNGTDQSGSLVLDLILRITTYYNHHSIFLLRLPSLIAGLISIWLVWILMKKLQFTLEQKIFSSILIAFLPGMLWLGQDARPYGIVALLLLGAFWYSLDHNWLGLIATCGLTMYAHTTAGVYAIGIFAVAIYVYRRIDWKILLSGLAIGISWVPALVRIFIHGDMGRTALQPWAAHLTGNWFIQSGLIAIWANAYAYLDFFMSSFIILSFTLAMVVIFRNNKGWIILTLSWVLPLILIMLASMLWENVIQYRTLMPLLFLFCLWLGYVVLLRPVTALRFMCGSAWSILLIISLFIWKPAQRGAYLDQITADIRNQFQTGDLLVYSTDTAALATNFYLGDLPHYQWNVSSNWLLMEPGVKLPNTGDPLTAKRIWLFTPNDVLLTDQEEAEIHSIIPNGQKSIYLLTYLQTSNIEIYLLDASSLQHELSK
jgi:hypothetical protein